MNVLTGSDFLPPEECLAKVNTACMALSTDIERSHGELSDTLEGCACQSWWASLSPKCVRLCWIRGRRRRAATSEMIDEPGRVEVVRKYRQQVSS